MIYYLFCIVAIFFSAYELGASHSVRGSFVLLTAATVAIYSVGKIYCIEWEQILVKTKKNNSILLIFYEKILLPAIICSIIVGKDGVETVAHNYFWIKISILFLLLSDILKFNHYFLEKNYSGVSGLESKKLFLKFPPMSRFDMLPLDILLNFSLVFFLYKRFSN